MRTLHLLYYPTQSAQSAALVRHLESSTAFHPLLTLVIHGKPHTVSGFDLVLIQCANLDVGTTDQIIKLAGDLPDLPILVIADHLDGEQALRLIRSGIDDCLPFCRTTLINLDRLILHSIERHQATRQKATAKAVLASAA